MITVRQADKLISKDIKKYPSVRVPLEGAFGKILREDLIADRDLPPFDRVMMDGIAIDLRSWKEGNRAFPVRGIQKPGTPALVLKDPAGCLEVMTGALLPVGCDCVIPFEDIQLKNRRAVINNGFALKRMQNVHRKGSDGKKGSRLVPGGTRLMTSQVAFAASVGKKQVLVSRIPRIAIVGTGDEVIAIGQKVKPYQIRQSNAYAIEAALRLCGYDQVERFHVRDDKAKLTSCFKKVLKGFDVVILSGGVSMGRFDYVPAILTALGVKEIFHKVKERPGKPLWFGKNKKGKPVFGLPGNPISTQVCLYRYVLPYLNRSVGLKEPRKEFVCLSENVEIKTNLTYFLPVKIKCQHDGRLMGAPVFFHNSGDYPCLSRTDGFVELPANTFHFPKGTVARFYRWGL